jgi:anti-sigma factor RsiW
MEAAHSFKDCNAAALDAYVDGELEPGQMVEVDAHLGACERCAEQVALTRSTRVSLKRSMDRKSSESLRERMSLVMAQERASEDHRSAPMLRMRYAVGFAAAAGIAFAMGLTKVGKPTPVGDRLAPTSTATMTAGLDGVLDELVALHAEPLPPETQNPDELPRFDPLVGVPVRRPAFQPFGQPAKFDGARVHAMRDRRAALLQYTLANNHRVTVYVFDSRKMPVDATRLQPRFVRGRGGERPVYVGTMRGYSVAAAERAGVGYALASDLGSDQSSELVLAVAQP